MRVICIYGLPARSGEKGFPIIEGDVYEAFDSIMSCGRSDIYQLQGFADVQ